MRKWLTAALTAMLVMTSVPAAIAGQNGELGNGRE